MSEAQVEPTPGSDRERAVVATSLDADRAAECLRATGQPGWVLPIDAGSMVIVADVGGAMSAASVASRLTGTRPALTIWYGDVIDGPLDDESGSGLYRVPAAGLVIFRRGRAVVRHTWSTLQAEQPDAAAEIIDAVGSGVHVHELRAVLRRTDDPRAALSEAVELLGFPAMAPALFEHDLVALGATFVAADESGGLSFRSFWRVTRSARPQWLVVASYALPAVVALQFAVRAVLAYIDRSGWTSDVVGYTVLGLVAGSVALMWFWLSRRAPQ